MKKSLIIVSSLSILFFASCVSSSKYGELESKERAAQNKLNNCEKERTALKGNNENLTQNVKDLENSVNSLKDQNQKLSDNLGTLGQSHDQLQEEYNQMQEAYKSQLKGKNLDIEKVREENLATQKELEKRNVELSEKEKTFAELQAQFSQKEKTLLELQAILSNKDKEAQSLRKKISDALLGFENKGLTINIKNGKVYVSMDEKLLFASGSWTVADEGKKALKGVAKVLAENPDINVMIEGHTDDVPFKGKSDVKDNWDLSVMRATSITKELLLDATISPSRISSAGRGEFVPVAPNNSAANKAKNRRTEIILTPKLDELLNVLESN